MSSIDLKNGRNRDDKIIFIVSVKKLNYAIT